MSARPNLLVIRVADLDAARTFYEALGLEFRPERHGRGAPHLSCAQDGFVFELYPRRSEHDDTSALRLGFRVASLTQVLARLRATSAEVLAGPSPSEWGFRAVARDPDGHQVELVEASLD